MFNATEATAVFATASDGRTFRVADPRTYSRSLLEWSRLEDLRRKGRMPHVKLYEVRTVFVGPDRPLVGPVVTSHDRYDGAPVDLLYVTPVVAGGRGFKRVEAAARAAWKRAFPTFRSAWDKRMDASGYRVAPGARTGVQGTGGWFYFPNGQTAAQGLRSLAGVCKRRRMVVQGLDGRWYVTDPTIDDAKVEA